MWVLATVAFAEPRVWKLDPAASQLYTVVRYDRNRITPVTAHDHVVSASTFTGQVTWDAADVAACQINISFPVSALVVDPPGARERAGLDPAGAIDADTKATVVKNMTSKTNLFAASFPDIRYQSTKCAPRADGKVDVTGTLAIRGMGKGLTVPMVVEVGAESFRARGTFAANHADFGMSPFTYGPLTPKNDERLTFVVDVIGR